MATQGSTTYDTEDIEVQILTQGSCVARDPLPLPSDMHTPRVPRSSPAGAQHLPPSPEAFVTLGQILTAVRTYKALQFSCRYFSTFE